MTADTAAAIVQVLRKLADRIGPGYDHIAKAFREEADELEEVVLEWIREHP